MTVPQIQLMGKGIGLYLFYIHNSILIFALIFHPWWSLYLGIIHFLIFVFMIVAMMRNKIHLKYESLPNVIIPPCTKKKSKKPSLQQKKLSKKVTEIRAGVKGIPKRIVASVTIVLFARCGWHQRFFKTTPPVGKINFRKYRIVRLIAHPC